MTETINLAAKRAGFRDYWAPRAGACTDADEACA